MARSSRAASAVADVSGAENSSPIEAAGESFDQLIEAFVASMPKRYRTEFGRGAVRQHARIVAARRSRLVHAELFASASPHGAGLCVVAPDAPGLLAAVSSALSREDLDITRADAYTRKTNSGEYEAVDFFWVRRAPGGHIRAVGEADVAAVLATLGDILRRDGYARLSQMPLAAISPGQSETSVRFLHHYGVPWLTLELESNDRPGLLAVVTEALFAEGLQVVDCRIRTHGVRVKDSFDVIELDGTCPAGARLQRLQLAVLAAVDGPEHGA